MGDEQAVSETPSERVGDQRVRNRIMDALSWLAEGAVAVRRMSAQEFFAMFYDWVDDENPVWPWPKGSPSTMTPHEVEAVTRVLSVVNEAVEQIEDLNNDAFVIASGWLERIAPVARTALNLMLVRGCFDEGKSETEPSNKTFEAALRNNMV